MFILYKKNNNEYQYTDVWISEDEKIGFEHTGTIGTKGKTIETDLTKKSLDAENWAKIKEKFYRDQGFNDINEIDLNSIILQFEIPKKIVDKIEKETDENKKEKILNEIDNNKDYDELAISLTTLSFENGFFPGFDGFDLGYNNNSKPVINIYMYGLDGLKYAKLIEHFLKNEYKSKLLTNKFTIAYANIDEEENEEKYNIVCSCETNKFSI